MLMAINDCPKLPDFMPAHQSAILFVRFTNASDGDAGFVENVGWQVQPALRSG